MFNNNKIFIMLSVYLLCQQCRLVICIPVQLSYCAMIKKKYFIFTQTFTFIQNSNLNVQWWQWASSHSCVFWSLSIVHRIRLLRFFFSTCIPLFICTICMTHPPSFCWIHIYLFICCFSCLFHQFHLFWLFSFIVCATMMCWFDFFRQSFHGIQS